MPLRDLEIRALKPEARVYKRTDERGLYLEVHPNGSKLWRFKFAHLGKDKRIALGRYPEVGLADARRKRDEAMRRDLDHLPPVKQRELERVVQIIFEEFGDALALSKHEWKRKGRIQKVILYGSYARGGWVDEPHTAKGYQSDYDLLIIVNDKRLTDRVEFWLKLEERLNRELAVTKTLRTPVNFIVHTLQEVNDGLAHGRYFFMDVRADGIALYESEDTELHKPQPKTPDQAMAMAKEYFEEWLPSAQDFLDSANDAAARGKGKLAAFLYHQATAENPLAVGPTGTPSPRDTESRSTSPVPDEAAGGPPSSAVPAAGR